MYNIEILKKEIIDRLRNIDPKQIVIFGSFAQDSYTEDSDIDVYVVTKDQFVPKDYKEKRELVRKVSRQLIDLRQSISMDLLVHTDAMNKLFYDLNSSFAREIREKGIHLL